MPWPVALTAQRKQMICGIAVNCPEIKWGKIALWATTVIGLDDFNGFFPFLAFLAADSSNGFYKYLFQKVTHR